MAGGSAPGSKTTLAISDHSIRANHAEYHLENAFAALYWCAPAIFLNPVIGLATVDMCLNLTVISLRDIV